MAADIFQHEISITSQARRKQLQIGGWGGTHKFLGGAHIFFFFFFLGGGGDICANYWGGGGHTPPPPIPTALSQNQ